MPKAIVGHNAPAHATHEPYLQMDGQALLPATVLRATAHVCDCKYE